MKKDGTLKKPTTIWVVRLGDDVYVRAWNGLNSAWYNVAQQNHEGSVKLRGEEILVEFVDEPGKEVNEQINQAYLDKYGRSQYSKAMIGEEQQKNTMKLVPKTD